MGKAPLERFPLFHTREPALVEHGLIRTYGARKFDLPAGARRFEAAANVVQLPRIGLSFCQYASPVDIHFPEADYVRQQIVLSGSAAVTVAGRRSTVDVAHSFLTPPENSIRLECAAGFEQLVLTIRRDALAKHARSALGAIAMDGLRFIGRIDMGRPHAERLQRMLRFFIGELESDIPNPVLVEMEDALITAFLLGNPQISTRLEGKPAASIAPWQVKRAEEYIVANWRSPITIAKLSEHVGASARSLFKSFRDARGCSPMAFAKAVRLQEARRLLESSDCQTSVTGVALACRFANLGHFAKDYVQAFGELPSATLKRTRTGRGLGAIRSAIHSA